MMICGGSDDRRHDEGGSMTRGDTREGANAMLYSTDMTWQDEDGTVRSQVTFGEAAHRQAREAMMENYQYIFDEFFSIHDETVRAALIADYEAYVAKVGGNPMSFHRWLGNRVEQYGEGAALAIVAERDRLQVDNAAMREIVRRLCEADDAGVGYEQGVIYDYKCRYCGEVSDDPHDVNHAPDCPILVGRTMGEKGYIEMLEEKAAADNRLALMYQRENAVLRKRLAALVEADDARIMSQYAGNDYYACAYCDGYADEVADVQHASDCPITLARTALVDSRGANDG